MGILKGLEEEQKFNYGHWLQRVVRAGGPGPYKQLLAIFKLWITRSRVAPYEYYTLGYWMKNFDPDLKREFVPDLKFIDYNGALLSPSVGPSDDLIKDKLVCEALFQKHGFATVTTKAIFGDTGVPEGFLHLQNREAAIKFLSDPDNYPMFGKPRFGTMGRGVFAGLSLNEAHDRINFSDGTEASIEDLVDELTTDWQQGYVFQDIVQNPDILAKHMGSATVSIRIVTLLMGPGNVEVFYGIIRLPGKNTMHDGFSDHLVGRAVLDSESGEVLRIRPFNQPEYPDLRHWHDPETELLGVKIPHWARAISILKEAHLLFPAHGILGWDVFFTNDGPLLNEVNANPFHGYQRANMKGMKTPVMQGKYDRALAYRDARENAAK